MVAGDTVNEVADQLGLVEVSLVQEGDNSWYRVMGSVMTGD